jgi:regulatory protein
MRKASKVKAPLTEEALYESAVRALARHARSSGEMRQYLARKKAAKGQIDAIIHRLRDNGYLDDARFARYFAASRLEGDLHGKARIRRDLQAHKVTPEIVEQAVGAAFDEVNEVELLRQHLRRKLRVTKPLSNPSTVASIYRRLLRAGFASATIVQELKRLLQSARMRGRDLDAEPPSWDELLDGLSEHSETSSDTEAEIDE